MSECVIRMDMPKNRCPVRFSIAANGYCPIENRSGCGFDVTKERPSWRPIVCQLPEGHGRLVDINDVDGMFEAAQIISDDDCNCGYVTDDLRLEELPTIVPAERSDHEAD